MSAPATDPRVANLLAWADLRQSVSTRDAALIFSMPRHQVAVVLIAAGWEPVKHRRPFGETETRWRRKRASSSPSPEVPLRANVDRRPEIALLILGVAIALACAAAVLTNVGDRDILATIGAVGAAIAGAAALSDHRNRSFRR